MKADGQNQHKSGGFGFLGIVIVSIFAGIIADKVGGANMMDSIVVGLLCLVVCAVVWLAATDHPNGPN